MPSPLVRRMRLSEMLRQLREDAGLTGEQAAKRCNIHKLVVTRLETGKRHPDVQLIMKMLDAYDIPEDDPRYKLAVRLARDANEKGWWDSPPFRDMGDRPRLYADIESGARIIRTYQVVYVPGFLQTADFIAARNRVAAAAGLESGEAASAGRLRRQEEVLRPGGPVVEVIVEEPVVFRSVAAPDVMLGQLRHLLAIAEANPQVSIQILPLECDLTDVLLPGGPFDLYSFDDPDDGTALLMDSAAHTNLFRDPKQVANYSRLFDRLRGAAHSAKESAALIHQHAAKLAAL